MNRIPLLDRPLAILVAERADLDGTFIANTAQPCFAGGRVIIRTAKCMPSPNLVPASGVPL
ncbi:hypothetical protein [Jannaschia sp. CCS1]|uniref:hypothetical protein n=1 Tax=Jannaschia sp. (strain CCS1) TaxID=290400 RepID=UPI00031B0FA3|nr:hypothetical protein [Jannaschia sp. CCS1]